MTYIETSEYVLERAKAENHELSRWQLNEMCRRGLIDRVGDDAFPLGSSDTVLALFRVRQTGNESYEQWGFIAALHGIELPDRFWTENVAEAESAKVRVGAELGVRVEGDMAYMAVKSGRLLGRIATARTSDRRFTAIRRRVGMTAVRDFLRIAVSAAFGGYEPHWDEKEDSRSSAILGRAVGIVGPVKKKARPAIPDDTYRVVLSQQPSPAVSHRLEILADVRLRDALQVKDGDVLEIQIFSPQEWLQLAICQPDNPER